MRDTASLFVTARIRQSLRSGAWICLSMILLASSTSATPPIDPITSKVRNVPAQFFSINDHGTPSGFYRGTIDPNLYDHYQGISRHPTLGSVFFVSKNGDAASPPAVMSVYMPNENGTRQMKHNLWAKNANNTHGTYPNDGAYTYWEDSRSCRHFGGLQAAGKILAVAGEECHDSEHGLWARIYFYYVHNTYWPIPIDVTTDFYQDKDSLSLGYHTAGAVGIIEDSENLYTIAVFTDGNRKVRFRQFELGGYTMTATSDWMTYDTPSSQINGWETGTGAHQALNLIRQDDDTLFVAGAQRGILQSDHIFLYRVYGLYYDGNGHLYGSPYLHYQGKRKIYCTNWESTGSRMCDLSAAAGFYVADGAYGNENGELILLAGAHDDDKGPGRNVAPITEFRNKNVRVIDGNYGDCGTSSWATLYDDDHMDGDRNITITEHNSYLEDFKYLHNGSVDFGDKASAISYCIRPGCTLKAYKHSGYGSALLTVTGYGTGAYGFDNDLERSSGGYYGINWSNRGDEISSVKIYCQ